MTKVILTYGTFDMFHIGHLKLIERLKELGDRLIIGVSTDAFNRIKGKSTVIPYEQRAQIIAAIRGVDLVIPEENWEQKVCDIKKYNVDTFAIGNDWEGKFDHLKENCDVLYLERTVDVSTTGLKESLKNLFAVPKEDILKAFEVLEILKRDFE